MKVVDPSAIAAPLGLTEARERRAAFPPWLDLDDDEIGERLARFRSELRLREERWP